MAEQIEDKDLTIIWKYFDEHIQVTHRGTEVLNTSTSYVSPILTARQVGWLKEYHAKNKKHYVFA